MSRRPKMVVIGPLAPYADGLRPALAAAGYGTGALAKHYGVLRQLSGWLAAEELDAAQLTEEVAERFVLARRTAGYSWLTTVAGLGPLLTFLRDVGPVPPAPPPEAGRFADVLDAYQRYLQQQRRLAPLTVTTTVGIVRRFLAARAATGSDDLARITVGQVHAFVLAEASRLSTGATRASVSALRSFLRYLFATGVLPRDLASTVPGVAGSRLASLPRGLDAGTVSVLLGSCDRRSAVGRRDFAILTLQVRLGLRAHEVAAMLLDDIDWRAGELTVRGKGGRLERLPLPADVGEALVDYLRHGRIGSPARTVFLRAMAPPGPITRNAVVMVSRTASRRAGVPVIGTHRLRHTAATEMLRAGATLREVGQVLRHNSDATTAIYAKVDYAALNTVTRVWAETGR